MNDTSPEASIQRFVADLKRIREARDVSLADIHEATRISKDVLDDFESGDLFNRSSFNPVYLRSLAKSYAQEVSIAPAQRVLECLELAQSNRYTNELAVDELGEEPLSIAWPDDDRDDASDDAPTSLDDSAFNTPSTESAGSTAAGRDRTGASNASARRWREVPDTEEANDPTTSRSSSTGGGRQVVILSIAFVLLIGGIVGGLVYWSGADDTSSEREPPVEDTTPPPPDTAQTDAPASEPEVPTPELGGTVYATLYASNGNVQGVRVQRDDDIRRPYWIEEGDAVVMPFTERISIEEQLDQFELFINEYPIPVEPLDSQGRRVLTRDDLESWADTTQTPPADGLPTPVDTLRIP